MSGRGRDADGLRDHGIREGELTLPSIVASLRPPRLNPSTTLRLPEHVASLRLADRDPEPIDHDEANSVIRCVAEAIANGAISPDEGITLIHQRVVSPLGHREDLMRWCALWEGLTAGGGAELEDSERAEAIRSEAVDFLTRKRSVPLSEPEAPDEWPPWVGGK